VSDRVVGHLLGTAEHHVCPNMTPIHGLAKERLGKRTIPVEDAPRVTGQKPPLCSGPMRDAANPPP